MLDADLPSRAQWWKWALVPLRRYAQFEGRSAALEFWMYSLFLVAGYLAIALVGGALASATQGDLGGAFIGFGMLAFFVANFIPGLALTARRLHDFGFSGHWIWAIYGALFFLNAIAWLGYLVLMSLPGNKVENAYGPPVYADQVADVFS